jgi:hypothetical protein
MTKFADQLFDDLMREHGPTLARTRVPAPKRHLARRPVFLTASAGGLAVAATVGTLVAGGGTSAYAVTTHPDGTVTLSVYQKSGIAEANAKLHQVGDGRVVVVPAEPGCPSISSLPGPAVPTGNVSQQGGGDFTAQRTQVTTQGGKGIERSGRVSAKDGKASVPVAGKPPIEIVKTKDGSAIVSPLSVPDGDILVLAYSTTASGMSEGAARLTSGPVPSCVSLPAPPAIGGPGGATARGSGSAGRAGIAPGGDGPAAAKSSDG